MEIFEMLQAIPYLGDVLQIVLALHGVAILIVNMTDTPKDNEIVAKVYKYIELAAGFVRPSKAKQANPFDDITKRAP